MKKGVRNEQKIALIKHIAKKNKNGVCELSLNLVYGILPT